MIAAALACNPRLLIADEPTTALDVTIQLQILDLIAQLQGERDMAVLLITHNLGVVADIADEVMVMYAGQIIEAMPVETVFTHPWHPYTHGLLASIPSADRKVKELNVIPGVVPSPLFFSKFCRFAPRCRYASERCRRELPPLGEAEPGHLVRCFNPLSDERGGHVNG
jgi:oligopeptide/dipeptide ABC transporter ATP-binding protein